MTFNETWLGRAGFGRARSGAARQGFKTVAANLLRMKEKRRYTDEQRAEALAALQANGGGIPLTARQLGIPENTLRSWARGLRHPEATQMCEEKKLPLAERFESLAHSLLDHADKNLKDLNAKDAVTSAAIAVDKMRLLKDLPTTITGRDSRQELGQLSSDELQAYEHILHRLAKPAAPAALPGGSANGNGTP